MNQSPTIAKKLAKRSKLRLNSCSSSALKLILTGAEKVIPLKNNGRITL